MIDVGKALLTVLFALVAHAGANVINDYHDALSGADAGNDERLFPFTGGSRFIQNGVLSLRETRFLGYGLLAAVIPAGHWLTAHSAGGLIWIGLAGLLIACLFGASPATDRARCGRRHDCWRLLADADKPARLAPAIKATILAANLHGLLISVALVLSARA